MINDAQVLRVERLRDSVEELRRRLRKHYPNKRSAVSAKDIKRLAAETGERWLVEVAGEPAMLSAIGENIVAQLSVSFQQLITYSERNTQREKYDQTLNFILKDFRPTILVPLKAILIQGNTFLPPLVKTELPPRKESIVFIGQSFSPKDKVVNDTVRRFFTAIGLNILTGEKPQAGSISKKVTDRIDQADIFVGIFTRRDKIENKNEWSTSPWVIEEKVYAYTLRKKLIVLRETGVGSIGGILGDYEYVPFDRDSLVDLVIDLAELYNSIFGI
jgi:hypothetical protein